MGVRFASLLLAVIFSLPVQAREDVYLSPDQFIAEAIGAPVPKPEMLWLSKDVRAEVSAILGHTPA